MEPDDPSLLWRETIGLPPAEEGDWKEMQGMDESLALLAMVRVGGMPTALVKKEGCSNTEQPPCTAQASRKGISYTYIW